MSEIILFGNPSRLQGANSSFQIDARRDLRLCVQNWGLIPNDQIHSDYRIEREYALIILQSQSESYFDRSILFEPRNLYLLAGVIGVMGILALPQQNQAGAYLIGFSLAMACSIGQHQASIERIQRAYRSQREYVQGFIAQLQQHEGSFLTLPGASRGAA